MINQVGQANNLKMVLNYEPARNAPVIVCLDFLLFTLFCECVMNLILTNYRRGVIVNPVKINSKLLA